MAAPAQLPSPTLFLSNLPPQTPKQASESLNPHLRLRQSLRKFFPSSPTPSPNSRAIRNLPELQRAILQARSRSLRVRVATTHASHHHVHSHQHLTLDITALNGLSYHPARAVVVAQAGVTIPQFTAFCAQHHVMPCGMVRAASASTTLSDLFDAGAVAFCTNDGLFADNLAEISIVDAHGRLRVYSPADTSGLFLSAKASLGLFGVMYDLTVRVQPIASVLVSSRCIKFAELSSEDMNSLSRQHVAAELTWAPFNSYKSSSSWSAMSDKLHLRFLDSCEQTSSVSSKPNLQQSTIPQWILRHAKRLVDAAYTRFDPSHTPLLLSLGFSETRWKMEMGTYTTSLPDAINNLHLPTSPAFSTLTVSIPLDAEQTALQSAWKTVVKHVEASHAKAEYPMNGPMRIRFSRGSDGHLAATNCPRAICALLSVSSARNTAGWATFAASVLEELLQLPGVRPVLTEELVGWISKKALQGALGESLKMFRSIHANSGVDDYGMLHSKRAEVLEMPRSCSTGLCTSPVSSAGEPSRERYSVLQLVRSVPQSSLDTLGPAAALGCDLYYYDDDSDVDMGLMDVGMMRVYQREAPPVFYSSPLSQAEISLLYVYIFLYALAWLFLFGADAVRMAGWID